MGFPPSLSIASFVEPKESSSSKSTLDRSLASLPTLRSVSRVRERNNLVWKAEA